MKTKNEYVLIVFLMVIGLTSCQTATPVPATKEIQIPVPTTTPIATPTPDPVPLVLESNGYKRESYFDEGCGEPCRGYGKIGRFAQLFDNGTLLFMITWYPVSGGGGGEIAPVKKILTSLYPESLTTPLFEALDNYTTREEIYDGTDTGYKWHVQTVLEPSWGGGTVVIKITPLSVNSP